MRLEIGTFPVRDVQLGDRTAYQAGVLTVDQDELRRLILAGGDFEDVALEVARPGDATRLMHIMDVVEPRYKLDGSSTFPGFVGPQKTVGEGPYAPPRRPGADGDRRARSPASRPTGARRSSTWTARERR